MSQELKSCPFCGGEARLQMGDGLTYSRTGCTKCWATAVGKPTDKESVKAWNTRPPHPSTEELDVVKLKELVAELERCKLGLTMEHGPMVMKYDTRKLCFVVEDFHKLVKSCARFAPRRAVKWPEKKDIHETELWLNHPREMGFNEGVAACIKAHDEADEINTGQKGR